jgi:exosortase B
MTKVLQRIGFSKMLIEDARSSILHLRANSGLWLMFAGLALMFMPTLWTLLANNGLWTDDEHAHGPIILAISIWLLWKRWQAIPEVSNMKPSPKFAWVSFFIAASLYIPGRALDIIYLETASFIFAVSGIVLMSGGIELFKKLKFPLFFMIFMVPLPNSLVGPITDVMKLAVSTVTVKVLSWAGFQVARSGVVIYIEQYQLLVADACAGMRTLFMLEALGILYLNLVHHQSMLRNIVLPILIIPISFMANVVRVIILALITHFFGLEFGMGFMHGFAGAVLFVVGLFMMFSADSLLRLISKKIYATS